MLAPHSLMTFFSIAGALGTPAATGDGPFIDLAAGIAVIERIKALVAHIEPSNFAMDPIAASEAMARKDALVALMPYGYGYVSYALDGFRPHRLAMTNLPSHGRGPVGSALGGTGIAVSAFSRAPEAARDYAYWVASAAVQAGLYAQSGGQPGHAAAWESDAVNGPTGDFYRNTRHTLDGAWVRPRHNGYMAFQHAASMRLNEGLLSTESPGALVRALDALYRASFRR
jgi:multiple sugar transport system substrate-binding protein